MESTQHRVELAVRRFAEIARAEITRDHARASCIASTWLTLTVFDHLGFRAQVLETVVSVGNSAYARRLRRTPKPHSSMQELEGWFQADGSHVVGVGHDQTLDGIGGHLVALVEQRFIVDASLDQVADSEHGLELPSVFVLEVDPADLAAGVVRNSDDGLFVEYVTRPVRGSYRTSPDWGQQLEVQQAAQRVLQLMGSTPSVDA